MYGIGRSLSNSVFAGISYGSRHGSPDSSELVGRYPRENAETDLEEASEVKQDRNTFFPQRRQSSGKSILSCGKLSVAKSTL